MRRLRGVGRSRQTLDEWPLKTNHLRFQLPVTQASLRLNHSNCFSSGTDSWRMHRPQFPIITSLEMTRKFGSSARNHHQSMITTNSSSSLTAITSLSLLPLAVAGPLLRTRSFATDTTMKRKRRSREKAVMPESSDVFIQMKNEMGEEKNPNKVISERPLDPNDPAFLSSSARLKGTKLLKSMFKDWLLKHQNRGTEDNNNVNGEENDGDYYNRYTHNNLVNIDLTFRNELGGGPQGLGHETAEEIEKWNLANMHIYESSRSVSIIDRSLFRMYILKKKTPDGPLFMMNSYNLSVRLTSLITSLLLILFRANEYIMDLPIALGISYLILKVVNYIGVGPKVYADLVPILMRRYPLFQEMRFSRELPDPAVQSKDQQLSDEGYTRSEHDLIKQSLYWRYRFFQLRMPMKHGLAYNVADNLCVGIIFPILWVLLYSAGLSEDNIQWFIFHVQQLDSFDPQTKFLRGMGIVLDQLRLAFDCLDAVAIGAMAGRYASPFLLQYHSLVYAEVRFGTHKYIRPDWDIEKKDDGGKTS